ncbi:unnamed protein product [Caenorhabditis bovis]|uniref:CARD domain-containing protein n=1 Tax=Caenorhabditis bovis TaxID=2654633 RepID=A0A8S1EV36_9PELO|nr:unnamed protein product [Caenorhabditis bovis]
MDQEDGSDHEERPDSQLSDTKTCSEYGTPVKTPTCNVENSLYDKYNVQEKELERLEAQNNEYRDKLLKTIRERDLNEEMLKNVQSQHKKELDVQFRRVKDLEVQLKATMDKATAQEAHFNVTTREMSQKYNNSVQQLTRKADQNEKEKNEAVVKYAMREGEMMKLKTEIAKKEQELKACNEELEQCRKSQAEDNLTELNKTINNLNVEIEKIKHEKFDVENRLKIAEKRVETLTSNLAEAHQKADVLRKQLIQAKDERAHAENAERARREADLEKRAREAESDLERMKASQMDLATKFEESRRENDDLLAKIDILQDQLNLEEDRRKFCEEQIERLKTVEEFVESSTCKAEESQKERENAEKDRVQAEIEAAECREHAERMLKLTQELTERNMSLTQQLKVAEEENLKLVNITKELEQKVKTIEHEKTVLEEENMELRESLNSKPAEAPPTPTTSKFEDNLKRFEENARKLEAAENELSEVKNDFAAYRKKTNATIKELKTELSTLRKSSSSNLDVVQPAHVSSESVPSSRSRASSITSIDRVTSVSREEEAAAAAVEEAKKLEVQQVMIDKIVVLQRKLARRAEKIEFLEEHIRQCLEELQKKSKIIQHYALREEASLLMPSDGSLEQVPIARKNAACALMGAMFTSTGEKKQTQLLTEINSRLQAVLEDAIQKNINLRANLDQISAENSRLSRENRLLSLAQTNEK